MNYWEYRAQYPNYCRACQGVGLFDPMRGPRPFNFCVCILEHRCPRCAHALGQYEDDCVRCGWRHRDPDRGAPDASLTIPAP